MKPCRNLLILHHMTYLVHDLLIQLSILTHWIYHCAAPVLIKQRKDINFLLLLIGYEHQFGDEKSLA